ncbi:hypothetical protein ACFO5Q_02330 [Kordiimonas lipolytica]|uniref:Uncharacterized protein n=1 Tax=Kordiimonas lipolytica TaxID=1662421 RepID=A0ABV8U662_9PROT|nr:hypothetical protein [Kordiimonas lipolytica]
MRFNVALVAFMAFSSCINPSTFAEEPGARAHSKDERRLHELVGDIITDIDTSRSHKDHTDAFGASLVINKFEVYYNDEVRHMGKELRIKYFLAMLWHVGFDGCPMGAYISTVRNDPAAAEFVRRLETFIQREEERDGNSRYLFVSKAVLKRLKA